MGPRLALASAKCRITDAQALSRRHGQHSARIRPSTQPARPCNRLVVPHRRIRPGPGPRALTRVDFLQTRIWNLTASIPSPLPPHEPRHSPVLPPVRRLWRRPSRAVDRHGSISGNNRWRALRFVRQLFLVLGHLSSESCPSPPRSTQAIAVAAACVTTL